MKIREKYNAKFLAFVFVLAAVLGFAEAARQGWWEGLQGFAIVMGLWLVLPLVPWDGLELLQKITPRDERQGMLGLEALAVTGGVMSAAALVGAIIDTAHGRDGEFATMCVVGGISYFAACLILPRVKH